MPGTGGRTLPLALDDYGSAGGQRVGSAHEREAFATAVFGLAKVDDGYGIHTVVDDGAEVGAQLDEFYEIEVADENRVLHRPPIGFHGFVNLPQTLVVSDVIRH